MATTDRDAAPTLGATRARSGRMGRSIFWVLLFGTLLAALGLFIAWTLRSGDLASTEAARNLPAESQAFEAPIPAPVTPPPESAGATPN